MLGHARVRTRAHVLGTRNGQAILNPASTTQGLARMALFVAALTQTGGHMLFVCTRGRCQPLVRHVAHRFGHSSLTSKWIGGTLTNWTQVQTTKGSLQRFPDALVLLNPYDTPQAIREAQVLHIPVLALVDTDTPLEGIQYPIPGNDDSDHMIYTLMHRVAQIQHTGPTYANN